MDRSCDNIIGYVDRHSLKQQYRKQRDSNRGNKRATEAPRRRGKSIYSFSIVKTERTLNMVRNAQ